MVLVTKFFWLDFHRIDNLEVGLFNYQKLVLNVQQTSLYYSADMN